MSQQNPAPAILVLEDGTTFRGVSYGATGTRFGQLVFTTGMSGYQEVLTDPATAGKIVVFTFPHIGNTGINANDAQSENIWAEGLAIENPARIVSSHLAEGPLEPAVASAQVVGIQELDTRAVTTYLREHGTMKAGIFSGDDVGAADSALVEKVKAFNPADTQQMLKRAAESVSSVPAVENGHHKVAVVNLGVRKATLKQLAERGFAAGLVAPDATAAQIKDSGVDGVVISTGPGDARKATDQQQLVADLLEANVPVLGLGLGHQLVALAAGLDIAELSYGHHGPNQPVKNLAEGTTLNTTQNRLHGVKLDADSAETPFGQLTVTHRNLNDNTVEGFTVAGKAVTAEFYPEDANISVAEPHPIFDAFAQLLGTDER